MTSVVGQGPSGAVAEPPMVGTPVRYDHLVVREPGRHGFAALQHCSTAALQQSAAGLAVVARGAVFAQSGTAAKREPSGETPESPDISP